VVIAVPATTAVERTSRRENSPIMISISAVDHLPAAKKIRSHQVLFQEIEGHGEEDHILHQERGIECHCRKPARRLLPNVGEERNDGDGADECNRSARNSKEQTPRNQVAPWGPSRG
jgi:hypothetical protein